MEFYNVEILDNYGNVKGLLFPEKPLITKVAIMTYKTDKDLRNIVLPILRVGIHRKLISHQLIIHTEDLEDKYIEMLKQIFSNKVRHSVMYAITNDPRIKYAGSSISLGYFCFRFYIENARVISYKPLVFETENAGNLILKPHLPQL